MDAVTLARETIRLGDLNFGREFDWAEQCERAQWFAYWATRGVKPSQAYGTARLAYRASKIASKDMNAAPAGSVSFYDKSTAGHVVTNLGNGFCLNTSPLMAGRGLMDFGRNLRITRLADYFPQTYLGWSYQDGARAQLLVDPWTPPGGPGTTVPAQSHAVDLPGIALSGPGWAFNPPTQDIQKRVQIALRKRGRYSGKENGLWGKLSVTGIQNTAANVAPAAWRRQFTPGVPGAMLCLYVQTYAKKFGGYTYKIDKILGPNSWLGFVRGLEAGLK